MTKAGQRLTAAELAEIAVRTEGFASLPDRDCACLDCDVARLLAHIAYLEADKAEREADLCALVGEVTRLHEEIEQMRVRS